MLREHMISFLEAVVVFLLFTNALSAVAATYALWMANSAAQRQDLLDAAGRKVSAMLRRAA